MKGLKEAHSWLVCEIERERRKKHPPSTAAIAIAAFGRILHGGDVRVEADRMMALFGDEQHGCGGGGATRVVSFIQIST